MAEQILAEHASTTRVPAEFFEDLLAALGRTSRGQLEPHARRAACGIPRHPRVSYRSQAFDPERHDVAAFSCGELSLDTWLREQAAPATARRAARTWVWTDEADAVVGYYALAAHRVSRDDAPASVGRAGPVEIPAVLLAHLALSVYLRGQELGEVLLADALGRIVVASKIVAARLVVADALHEKVAGFYARLGFRRIPSSLLLVQKVTDIETSV